MHNGMFKTLEEVLDYYDNPRKLVSGGINTDDLLRMPLTLTDKEKKDIIAFLKTLTDKKYIKK
jgi:cytochrome c peroxidase